MNANEILRDKIIEDIRKLKTEIRTKKIKRLQIDRLENMVNKLYQHSDNCHICSNFLITFENNLLNNLELTDKSHLKNYMTNFRKIVSHLCKKHKLVTKGSSQGTFTLLGMSFGMSIGASIGMIFDIDNQGSWFVLGMSFGTLFGMSFGMLLGTILDSNAKKKGNVI
ncbi:UNVERIFIED_CONTAM: hypothetical protein Cloal_3584 [Acetivibrio alkalicellulosi]